MVDDHLCRRQRVDLVGVATESSDGLTHRGEVDDARHPGEVLHDHAGGGELDLDAGFGTGIPVGERLDVLLGDIGAVLGAQQVLGEDLEAVGQPVQALDRVQAVDLVVLLAHREGGAGSKAVDAHICSLPLRCCACLAVIVPRGWSRRSSRHPRLSRYQDTLSGR